MRKDKGSHQSGDVIEYNNEDELIDSPHFARNNTLGSKPNGKRVGDITTGVQRHMEEGEDSTSAVHMDKEKTLQDILEDYKNKIKNAVSARLLGKKINMKLSGDRKTVEQIVKLIKLETEYLKNIMSGQGADAPILQKMKAEIDGEANVLDRMLGANDFWPFK